MFKKMKKTTICLCAFLTACVGLAGCNAKQTPGNNISQSNSNSNLSYEETISKLEEIERKQNELDNEEDNLKARYRNGEITRDEYMARIKEIDNQILELNRQEDQLEAHLETVRGNNSVNIPVPNSAPTATNESITTNSPATTTNPERDAIVKELAQLAAESEALDFEEDNLEYQYRTGQIDRNTFLSKISELEKKELENDKKENELELKLFNLQSSTQNSQSGGTGNVPSELYELGRKDKELEIKENELELKYRNGEISREEFLKQMAELEMQEELLDREEDLLEGDFD